MSHQTNGASSPPIVVISSLPPTRSPLPIGRFFVPTTRNSPRPISVLAPVPAASRVRFTAPNGRILSKKYVNAAPLLRRIWCRGHAEVSRPAPAVNYNINEAFLDKPRPLCKDLQDSIGRQMGGSVARHKRSTVSGFRHKSTTTDRGEGP